MTASRRTGAGSTLVELIVALVVVAVLVAIAVPTYRAHVLRTRRTDATAALTRAQSAQERFFLEHNRYATSLASPPPAGLGIAATSDAGLYELTLATADDSWSFRIVARARRGAGAPYDSRCSELSIDQSGMRRAQDATGLDTSEECWR